MSFTVSKVQIDNFIRCPYYFALEAIGSQNISNEITGKKINAALKSSTRKIIQHEDESVYKSSIRFIKDYVSRIALNEMTNDSLIKTPLHEYRLAYTNKFSRRFLKQANIDNLTLINNLNCMFEVFASNTFLGYNMPVEVPIHRTDIIYRDIIDFILTDQNGDIIIVELDDLSSSTAQKKYLEWPQYIIPYLFIANSLEKDVTVKIIDPVNTDNNLLLSYKQDRFDYIYTQLAELITPIKNTNLIVRNFYACSDCKYINFCKESVEWKL